VSVALPAASDTTTAQSAMGGDIDIRDEACTTTFKQKLKTFYFSQAFDCN